ncbi:hypothetical protein E2C01_035604 [Portunus trituberculatus]|uniref:Uncharacterized protein n=1 Tax=Portunus trituberculatus TaxID=210409 RepID=A0A5B7FA77_PORTR|nr:hypothetical protein [Portunus trituberculatus]
MSTSLVDRKGWWSRAGEEGARVW